MNIDKLDDVVNIYNNTYHITIQIEPAYVEITTYIDFRVENNQKSPKFKANEHVKNIEIYAKV